MLTWLNRENASDFLGDKTILRVAEITEINTANINEWWMENYVTEGKRKMKMYWDGKYGYWQYSIAYPKNILIIE